MEDNKQLRGANANIVKTDVQSVADILGSKQPTANQLNGGNQVGVATEKISSSASFQQIDTIAHNDQPHPFFYHTNTTKHHFTLHSPPSHSTYNTTLSLIVSLHLLYIYQWNKRLSRSDVATNYEQLVNQRQYWRGALAVISHPPIEGGERQVMNDYSSHENDSLNGDDVSNTTATRRFQAAWIVYSRIQSFIRTTCAPFRAFTRRILHPLVFGHLSGLPLLAFVSHVLWQCRALEEIYDVHGGILILGVQDGDSVRKFVGMASHVVLMDSNGNLTTNLDEGNNSSSYLRVLIALATTSMLLEISFLRAILRRMDRHIDFNGYSTTPRTLLSQRAICSLTSLSAAVLSVYDAMFPYAPPPILPFVKVPLVNSSGFSLLFSIIILCILAHRIHPVTSVVSGLLSGTLWALGVTSFLGTRYWGNFMIGCLFGAILLSLKTNPSWSTYLGLVLPCLDYVSWEGQGNFRESHAPTTNSQFGNSRMESNELEMGQSSYLESNDMANNLSLPQSSVILERRPLLAHNTDSTLSDESRVIRGRVPFINSMESDLDDRLSVSNVESRPDGNLSRRARGV
jgi:hypothetical protein